MSLLSIYCECEEGNFKSLNQIQNINMLEIDFDDHDDSQIECTFSYNLLHLSILYKNLYVMEALLKLGADPSFPNISGYSPLDIAIDFDNIECNVRLRIFRLLVKYGAYPSKQTKSIAKNSDNEIDPMILIFLEFI